MIDELRNSGLNLIPLKVKSKIPIVDWKAYQTKRYESPISGNYGVICGKISGDLFVIDLDSPQLYPLFEAFIDRTLVVKTGKGYHFYFKALDGKLPKTVPLKNKDNFKLDIRSEGSYVVGPGSIHESGSTYQIISKVTEILTIDPQVIKNILVDGGFKPDEKLNIDQISKGKLSKGSRNNSAFVYACHLLGKVELDEDTAWREMLRWNSENDPPMSEYELKATFASAKKRVLHDMTVKGRLDAYTQVEEEVKPVKEELDDITDRMRDIRAETHEGKLITFDCFITGMEEHKSVTIAAEEVCPDCGGSAIISGNGYENVRPTKCSICSVKKYLKSSNKTTTDVRTIIIQELPEEAIKNNPKRFFAKVRGKDVDRVFIGQRKRVTGEFRSKPEKSGDENEIMILISKITDIEEQEDITMTETEIEEVKKEINNNFIETKLVSSFAPEIYGHEELKELFLLTIAGGFKIGSRRGDINMMVVGNPSKGKSQLLKFAELVTSKSTYVNGRGSSSAGLLYGMVKLPNGTSIPQAGPFVLNSGGFVLLDEVDKMSRTDRNGLLEAMEQQTVSLAKAGVNLCVKAETAVIAAANPHFGRWVEKDMTIMDNLQPLEKPFISRFDIIWAIKTMTKEQNSAIASHIINQGTGQVKSTYMDVKSLKHYLNYVRKLRPILSVEAGKKIEEFYNETQEIMEKAEDRLPLEERQLEGLIRLSTARAKLLMKDQVDITDVERIIYLSKRAIESFGIKVENGTQMHLPGGTKSESDQQAFLTLFKSLEDADGEVTRTTLVEALKAHPQFSDKQPNEIIDKAYGKTWNSIYMPRMNVYKRRED